MNVEKAVEAILFTSPEAMKVSEIAKILNEKEEVIEKMIEKVAEKYRQMDSAIEVVKIGEKYLMRVKQEFAEIVERFTEKDLDKGTLRTLAVIALKQPITLSRLAKIRGNKCYKHVKKLSELKLIKAEKKGRSTILTTTEVFSSYFGFESKSMEEIRELLKKMLKS
ncbi:MAG: SMC-Scp complex subunit ScpB [Archaeoglobaceae archaeon]